MNISDLNLLAKHGDSNAQLQLGIMLVQKHEMHQGIHWILESVNQTGNMEGIFFLTVALNNVTSATDKKLIMQELLDRTEANECIAPYILGNCFEDSLFVKTDYEQSTHYYIRSAARGFFPAMEKLGAYYLQVKENHKEGILWYFRAIEAGSDEAWHPIGLNIFFNNDVSTVVDILIYCAEKGALLAQFLMARRYETGNGIEKNIAKANYWYARIAKYGNSLEDINTLIEASMYTTWGNIPKY